MTKQTRYAVPAGTWGGEGILLDIGESSSSLQFGCAEASITERLMRDSNGNFSAAGTFTRRTPGPTRIEGDASQKASFVGRISGSSMTMKIMLSASGESVGEYSLELNRKVRLQRCY